MKSHDYRILSKQPKDLIMLKTSSIYVKNLILMKF